LAIFDVSPLGNGLARQLRTGLIPTHATARGLIHISGKGVRLAMCTPDVRVAVATPFFIADSGVIDV
jgi:hypothetical protein